MNITGTKHDSVERVDLNMTSMIDCVFLLLIFFIMTLAFPKVEGNLPAHLPKGGRPGTPAGLPPKPTEVVVRLDFASNALQISVNGKDLGNSLALLKRKLALFRDNDAQMKVTIDGASDVPYEYVVNTLNICAGLGLRKVQFAQPREEA